MLTELEFEIIETALVRLVETTPQLSPYAAESTLMLADTVWEHFDATIDAAVAGLMAPAARPSTKILEGMLADEPVDFSEMAGHLLGALTSVLADIVANPAAYTARDHGLIDEAAVDAYAIVEAHHGDWLDIADDMAA